MFKFNKHKRREIGEEERRRHKLKCLKSKIPKRQIKKSTKGFKIDSFKEECRAQLAFQDWAIN